MARQPVRLSGPLDRRCDELCKGHGGGHGVAERCGVGGLAGHNKHLQRHSLGRDSGGAGTLRDTSYLVRVIRVYLSDRWVAYRDNREDEARRSFERGVP